MIAGFLNQQQYDWTRSVFLVAGCFYYFQKQRAQNVVDFFLKGGKKVKHLLLHANIVPNGGEYHDDFTMLD